MQDKGTPIAESSPSLATLDPAGPAVVVGDRSGYLYAFHLADGTPVPGWPVASSGEPIDSAPSVAPLAPGGLDDVFVGAGNAQHPGIGGYRAFGPGGQPLWSTNVVDPSSDKRPAYGVQASLTVTPVDGGTGVFAGSLDQLSYAVDASTGSVLSGWPFFTADSVFSTAAAADLYGTGQNELVMGGASTAGLAMRHSYKNGGHVRVLNLLGQQLYDYDTNQEVDSSPAVGNFLAGGATGIVVGTGSQYQGAGDTDTVKAFTARLGLLWSQTLDGATGSSPALADVQGNGQLDVVEGTDTGAGGSVWVLDGATGAPLWHSTVTGRVIGSVTTADLTGDGYQDLLVPTTHGVDVLDGRSGTEVTVLGPQFGFQNAPLVTDDPDGTIGITIAGYNGNNEGVINHYEISGSNGGPAVGNGSWPMFHHDAAMSGTSSPLPDLGRVTPTNLTAQRGNATVSLNWAAPAAGGAGPPTNYNIYVATAPGHEPSAPLNGATPVTGTQFTARGLQNGTTYYFEVTALTAAGEGAPSNEASATPAVPPGAPTNVSAVPGDAEATLSWSAPISNGGAAVTAYHVYISTSAGAQGALVATVTSHTYTALNLRDDSTYYFEISAINSVGEGPLSPQVAAVPTSTQGGTTGAAGSSPSGAPAGLSAAAGDGQVQLSWLPPPGATAASVSGYDVYMSGQPGTRGPAVITTSSTSATVTGLVDGTTYYFAVTAIGASGQGPASAQVAATPLSPPGYRMATAAGQVFAFGKLASYGARPPGRRVIALAATPDQKGYWLLLKNGALVAAGDARLYGSLAGRRLASPVAGLASAPDGKGYWVVSADGGIFAFGDAKFYGSMGAAHLNERIVGLAATPDGHGYIMVSADGGIFAFGDATFEGSLGSRRLNRPIVGVAEAPDGRGYWMVASDGGVFGFGDAGYYGSMGDRRINRPIVGIAATPDGHGYWMVGSDGGVFAFGKASFFGSLGRKQSLTPVVGIAS